MPTDSPLFTVVMPCLNEEGAIGRAVESLADEYFLENGEMLVVDGGSTDRTAEVVRGLAGRYPVRLLHNPDRLQAYGLNIGVKEARGRYIVRADAHCLYPPQYIRRCLAMLEREDVYNAGGVMDPVGETTAQKAIALAMRHPVGVGDAKFHLGNFTGYAEGAYVGAFKREVFDLVGPYDPKAHPNEDSELNIRIVKSGRKIYLDGSLKVRYFPRSSFGRLFSQYLKYGRGRGYTTLKHRRFTSPRQLAPPLFVLALAASLVIAPFQPLALAFPAAYAAAILLVSLFAKSDEPAGPKVRLLVARAFATMHLAWGLGFLSRLFGLR
jgi:glycosyltransferase involved in cell wall biosynthesis